MATLPLTDLSLNAIHVEVGGTSGTECTINDSDIRGIGNPNATYANEFGAGIASSGEISIGEFRGAEDTTDIPFSNPNSVQNNGTNDAAYSTRSVTAGLASVQTYFEVRLRRADPYVYLEVRERSSAQTSTWYNTSNQGTSLSTTYVTFGRFDLTGITAIRLDWTTPSSSGSGSGAAFGTCYAAGETNGPGATYDATSGSWQTVSNNQSIAFAFAATATAECYANRNQTCITDVTAYARKSGYNDTAMGTYQLESNAVATSNNCF